ncbi:MAG: B-box zinc finger protein [Promethearchaeota archaeon]
MTLSLEGWIDGLTITLLFISGCVIGLFFVYKSKKSNARLLYYAGFLIVLMGVLFLGAFLDFLTILLTGKNMDNTYGLIGLLSYIWLPPAAILMMYIGVEILTPDKKRYFLTFYSILSIIYYILLFSDPMASIHFNSPKTSGEKLIDYNANLFSPAGIIMAIFLLIMLIFNGFGFLYKSFKSEGVMKKKLMLFSIAVFIYFGFSLSEGYTYPGIALIFVRIGVMSSWVLFYFSLREEPEEKVELKLRKEVKVEGDLFRISKYKKEDITEEEVSISKEKKVCLVCKGKVGRYMFMCPECETFYCEKCAHALESIENACWVCGTPIDESKPIKPFKKEKEEEIKGIEIKFSKDKNS